MAGAVERLYVNDSRVLFEAPSLGAFSERLAGRLIVFERFF